MRFASFAVLTFLLLSFGSVVAQESVEPQPKRNLGSTLCRQTFSCSTADMNQLAKIANDCSVSGFGISMQREGIFDDAIMDSNGCMEGVQLGGAAPECCVIQGDGEFCQMQCTLR